MDIQLSKADGILSIHFDREDKKNAITAAMYQQLADALKEAETDSAVRAILFTGKPQAFSAGNDLEDFLKNPPKTQDAPVFQFLWQISHASKPIVAAVAGVAVGIGTTLLLHCDQVFIAKGAKLKMPFVNLGLCPEFGSSFLVPRLVGPVKASSLLLRGEGFTGEQAVAYGIANEALEDGAAALERAREVCQAFQQLPPAAVALSKRLLKAPFIEELRRVVAEEGQHFVQRLHSPEAHEALSAFTQRRQPDFSKFL